MLEDRTEGRGQRPVKRQEQVAGTEPGRQSLRGARSRFGYMCVEGMQFGPAEETIDPATGEVVTAGRRVLPTDYNAL